MTDTTPETAPVEVTEADMDKALLAHLAVYSEADDMLPPNVCELLDSARQRIVALTEAARQDVREALVDLLARDMQNTCQHENTYRGGAIWEICSDCDAKWADDEGGKPEWADPPEWVSARAALSTSPLANEDGELDLAAAFGPILKEGFPKDSAHKRAAVAEALAKAVMVRKSWLAPTARQKPPTTAHHTGLIEQAAQAALDAGLAENGVHGVAAARHAARFVVEAREYWREYERAELADEIRQISEARRPLANETGALREENRRLREHIAASANNVNIVGSAYDDAIKALDRLVAETKSSARAALASPDGEGK